MGSLPFWSKHTLQRLALGLPSRRLWQSVCLPGSFPESGWMAGLGKHCQMER